MHVLVLNVGSSSLKFDVYDTDTDRSDLTGDIQHIATTAHLRLSHNGQIQEQSLSITSHQDAIPLVNDLIDTYGLAYEAIGFRVVHGGTFAYHMLVTDEVLEQTKRFSPLAPLHNPITMQVVELYRAQSDKPICLIFDTVFYHTLPEASYTYPVPAQWRAMGVRKYGFHGLSHEYLYRRVNELTDAPRVISCHLGAGASITATNPQGAVDTSMGITPLAGIMMATRSGDIDPAVFELMSRETDLTVEQIAHTLTSQSGWLGMTGTANVKEASERALQGDAECKLALDIFVKRMVDYIAAYYVQLGGVDALVFAGGIGENSPIVRRKVVEALESLGFTLDGAANERNQRETTINGTRGPAIYIIKTDESTIIAHCTKALVNDRR